VFSLSWITLNAFDILYDEALLSFIFYATITGYNFVKSPSSKKPNFKFSSFGIPVGAELQCTLSPHIKCIVADRNNGVICNGKKTSMTAFINDLRGGFNRGTAYFTFQGKFLSDMVDQKS